MYARAICMSVLLWCYGSCVGVCLNWINSKECSWYRHISRKRYCSSQKLDDSFLSAHRQWRGRPHSSVIRICNPIVVYILLFNIKAASIVLIVLSFHRWLFDDKRTMQQHIKDFMIPGDWLVKADVKLYPFSINKRFNGHSNFAGWQRAIGLKTSWMSIIKVFVIAVHPSLPNAISSPPPLRLHPITLPHHQPANRLEGVATFSFLFSVLLEFIYLKCCAYESFFVRYANSLLAGR